MARRKAKFVKRWNYYRCTGCYRILVTVDIQDGVTPMIIPCKGTISLGNRQIGQCNGELVSAMYPPTSTWSPALRRIAMGEWYVPDATVRKRLSKETQEHVRNGGLILRSPYAVHRFPLED